MKKYLAIILLLALSIPMVAQERQPEKKRHADITELVSGLNTVQKRKIESISKESKARVDNLRRQQNAVRDSIRIFMDREGDQSSHLYPLFNREAQLQVAVNREMYATKLRIDEVLTKNQRAELRNSRRKK